jgi:hypothetical protein
VKRALAAAALALALPWAAPTLGQDRARKVCEAIEARVNALASFTSTLCTPAGGKSPGTYSFILLSEATVFGDDDRRRLWLVVTVAAAGSALNEDPALPVDELSFSDSQTLARERATFTLPAALAKRLQRSLSRGEIDVDAMYLEIRKGLREERAGRKPGR